ncbi:hypothetical protein [Photobacterium leiognathi]|uniref:hypothetical protein n=1 Tax=Photobacterium leiognathi TaxID=553611 RepID=UPI00273A57E3|nr:hypothetical protein [Photobacterium leiognathi]
MNNFEITLNNTISANFADNGLINNIDDAIVALGGKKFIKTAISVKFLNSVDNVNLKRCEVNDMWAAYKDADNDVKLDNKIAYHCMNGYCVALVTSPVAQRKSVVVPKELAQDIKKIQSEFATKVRLNRLH